MVQLHQQPFCFGCGPENAGGLRSEVHEGERVLAEAHGLWLVPRAT